MNAPSLDRITTKVSITFALSTLMVAVSVALAGSLVYFNYQRNHEVALLAAEDMLMALSKQIEDRMLTLVRPIVRVAELAPDIAPIGISDEGLAPSYRTFLTHLVEQLPHLNSIFIGLADGSFFQVASVGSFTPDYRQKLGVAPSATIGQYTIIPGNRDVPRRTVQYFAADGSPLSETTVEVTEFDPRERPWYVLAADAEGAVATPPYRFASSGEFGLTVAHRLPGERGGVLGVDITLIGLTRFLLSQRPTTESRLYLFTPKGDVLAWAGDADAIAAPDGDKPQTVSVPNLRDFVDPFAGMLRAHLLDGIEMPPQFDQEGQTYITRIERLTGPLGSTNYIGVVVPSDHFTGAITDLGRQGALLSILFILATVPLIALTSRVFSRPLQKLATEADAIRAFELEGPVEVASRVREIQALSVSMDRMKSGLRTFGVYVPKDLVRQMMSRSSPPRLGGERREITVLFTDVAGFTPIADGLEPEVVMQRMSAYFETATTALRQHGGTIDKFMGDAVMAMWNALVDDPAHAHSACRAVLAVREALTELSMRLVADGLAPMPTRFGLHTGAAVVGNVGSSERMNFTALGATVNLAARLEPLNKVFGTEILVSDQIAERVREHFHLRSVAIVRPKGVGLPLRIHELLGERRSEDDFGWTSQWETGFEAFVDGNLEASTEGLECLPEALDTDPVRTRLLGRIESARSSHDGRPWNPVEAF